MAFHIIGTGSALPSRSVTNVELSEFLDTSDEWIVTRTGIRTRRLCTVESLDDLAVEASRQALDDAGIAAADLDLIICSTTTGDHIIPAEACAIAGRLGVACPAFDVSAACAGFVYALDVADGFLERGRVRNVLVVAAEKMSRALDWTDRATCVLFGDGAAACVLAAGGASPLAFELSCMPDTESLAVSGIVGTSPFDSSVRDAGDGAHALKMDGRRVFKFGVTTICNAVEALCEHAQIDIDDIDRFIFHQANERILAAATARLGLDDATAARTLADTGNISSACIPYTLDTLARDGSLAPGDLIALVGFGAGLATGSALIRWE